jgi:hypothetical protein
MPLADDSTLCARHLKAKRRSDARTAKRRRQELRDDRRCAECGLKSDRFRCHGCSIRQNRLPTVGVGNGVGKHPAAEVWRVGTTESDSNTLRYRGLGTRGQVPSAVLDDRALKHIAVEIERGRQAIEYARSQQVAVLPKSQQRDALHAALSLFALARRFIDEMLDRHRYQVD